jgi:branched-chain amino acid transport system substrate-binding protein
MLAFAKSYIEKKGGKVVGDEYLPMDGSDWTPILSKLQSTRADAVITSTAGGAPNVTLTKQMRAAGIKIPYANLSVDEGTAKSMGSDAEGIFIAGSYMSNLDTPANKKFIASMQKKFGAGLKTPNDMSVPQYEAVYLYKAAVEKAGSVDTDKVIKALPLVSFDGPRGRIQMSKQHHTPLTMYLGQVQKDGSVKMLDSFANVDPGEQCPSLK